MRWFVWAVVLLMAGIFVGQRFRSDTVPTPTVVERLRAVSRLQVLEVSVSRKVSLRPDPVEKPSLTASLAQWARFAVAPPSGTAQVTGDAHFSLDLAKLDPRAVRVDGASIELTLPEPQVSVELSPESTQILTSNLDSDQTTELFARARTELALSAGHDPKLLEQSRESARRAITALLKNLGFKQVRFVGAPSELNSRLGVRWPRARLG